MTSGIQSIKGMKKELHPLGKISCNVGIEKKITKGVLSAF
jgi:hypothetical protein